MISGIKAVDSTSVDLQEGLLKTEVLLVDDDEDFLMMMVVFMHNCIQIIEFF